MFDQQVDTNDMMFADDVVPYTSAGFRLAGVEPAPSPATLHRWRLRGLRGHKIVTFLRAGRRFTTVSAIRRFFSAINAAAEGVPSPRSTSSQHVAHKRALAELERDGI